MLKMGMGSRERWSGEVGDVMAARARRGSGSCAVDGEVGEKEMYGIDGGMWKRFEVWKSSLQGLVYMGRR